jgi:hypothetical protein
LAGPEKSTSTASRDAAADAAPALDFFAKTLAETGRRRVDCGDTSSASTPLSKQNLINAILYITGWGIVSQTLATSHQFPDTTSTNSIQKGT